MYVTLYIIAHTERAAQLMVLKFHEWMVHLLIIDYFTGQRCTNIQYGKYDKGKISA